MLIADAGFNIGSMYFPILKKVIGTAWGNFTIRENMVSRGNRMHITNFDGTQLQSVPLFYEETHVVEVNEAIEMVLILEHHAAANNCVPYILSQGYEDMIVIELGGNAKLNDRFVIKNIHEKKPCPMFMWSDFDRSGVMNLVVMIMGSSENAVYNERLTVTCTAKRLCQCY